mmetsp:Transcript_58659/g.163704  ORF Transcript_58659/g.163704 Transcript_58659/m.163704 type:complete len:189 (-) Transcript_58659:650-1216(-)
MGRPATAIIQRVTIETGTTLRWAALAQRGALTGSDRTTCDGRGIATASERASLMTTGSRTTTEKRVTIETGTTLRWAALAQRGALTGSDRTTCDGRGIATASERASLMTTASRTTTEKVLDPTLLDIRQATPMERSAEIIMALEAARQVDLMLEKAAADLSKTVLPPLPRHQRAFVMQATRLYLPSAA